jgi:mono/diheme cytochrome c family protein
MLVIAWVRHDREQLKPDKPIGIEIESQVWSRPEDSVTADPSALDEPPLSRQRAARELQNPSEPTVASLKRGRQAYLEYCALCHGMEGRGDGPIAEAARVRPTDLTTALGRRTDGYVYATIRNGGAIMPPLGDRLSPSERWDVVNYLRSISDAPAEPPEPSERPHVDKGPIAPPLEDTGPQLQGYETSDPSKGRETFEARCAVCHDPTSTTATVGPGLQGLFQWPPHSLSDGTEHVSHTVEIIRKQIVEGGGAMAPMGAALSEEELADLIAYLQTL